MELLELLSNCGELMEINPLLYVGQVQGHCRSYSDAVFEAILIWKGIPEGSYLKALVGTFGDGNREPLHGDI